VKRIVVGLPALQMLLASLTVTIVALYPRADGDMLIIPLTRSAATHLAARALTDGATLSAPGPLPGSIVVHGDGPRLIADLLPAGILAIAAGPVGCGTIRRPVA